MVASVLTRLLKFLLEARRRTFGVHLYRHAPVGLLWHRSAAARQTLGLDAQSPCLGFRAFQNSSQVAAAHAGCIRVGSGVDPYSCTPSRRIQDAWGMSAWRSPLSCFAKVGLPTQFPGKPVGLEWLRKECNQLRVNKESPSLVTPRLITQTKKVIN